MNETLGDFLREKAAKIDRDPTPAETLALIIAWNVDHGANDTLSRYVRNARAGGIGR